MRKLLLLALACHLPLAFAKDLPSVGLKVYKSRGGLQCAEFKGTPPQDMRAELEKAGIKVKSVACGEDGLMRPAVCGAGDGAINIFEIPQAKAAQAASRGFLPLSGLPEAGEVPCPESAHPLPPSGHATAK